MGAGAARLAENAEYRERRQERARTEADGQSFAALLEGSDTKLYGTSANGGANLLGSVFRVDRDGGNFTILHSFVGADGSQPSAALVVGSDGKLYGTTTLGGASDLGTVFRIDSLDDAYGKPLYRGARRLPQTN